MRVSYLRVKCTHFTAQQNVYIADLRSSRRLSRYFVIMRYLINYHVEGRCCRGFDSSHDLWMLAKA